MPELAERGGADGDDGADGADAGGAASSPEASMGAAEHMLQLAAALSERDEYVGLELIGVAFPSSLLSDLATSREAAELEEAVRRSLEDCGPTPADPALVAALEVQAAPDAADGAGGACCSVCLERLLPGQPCPVFRCGHLLHMPCATAWLQSGSTCPVCMLPPWPDRPGPGGPGTDAAARDKESEPARGHAGGAPPP